MPRLGACALLAAAVAAASGVVSAYRSYMMGGWATVRFRNPAGFTPADLPDLSGRVAVVTGASGGLGLETARELARKGARVVLAARSMAKGAAAAETIAADVGAAAQLDVMRLDLADFASIRAFATEFQAKRLPLHMLILNGGVMAVMEREETRDGFEMQMGTNHVGHFLLTALLAGDVVASAPSRVVVVSSAHESPYEEGIRFDVLRPRGRPDPGYSFDGYYGMSKLANVLFAQELDARVRGRGVVVNAVHPGVIPTDLFRHLRGKIGSVLPGWAADAALFAMQKGVYGCTDSVRDGALTQLWAATRPDAGGKYFVPVAVEAYGGTYGTRAHPHASDADLQRRLWDWSVNETGTAELWAAAGAA